MANLLTDESRLSRYSVMRKRKKRYELVFDISMWATLLIALAELIPHFFNGVLYGFFIGEMQPFLIFLAVTASLAFFVFAISSRDWRLLLPAWILCDVLIIGGFFMLFGNMLPLFLTAALVTSFFWLRLSKEEGFPQFEISISENEEKQKMLERRTEYRTLQANIREAQAELDADAEMTDILDTDAKRDVMPAHLQNYHERFRNADAVVRPKKLHGDRMDQVQELPENPGEMDEL